MSANIYWCPVKKNEKQIDTMAPSSFIGTMEKAFGAFPLNLDDSHLLVLKGMHVMGLTEAEQIMELIGKYGEIKIWAKY